MSTIIILKTDTQQDAVSIITSILQGGAPAFNKGHFLSGKTRDKRAQDIVVANPGPTIQEEEKPVVEPDHAIKTVEENETVEFVEPDQAVELKHVARPQEQNKNSAMVFDITPTNHPCYSDPINNMFYRTKKKEPAKKASAFMRDDNPLFQYIDKNFILETPHKKKFIKYLKGEIKFLLDRNFYVSRTFFCRRYGISECSFVFITTGKSYRDEHPVCVTTKTLERAVRVNIIKSHATKKLEFAQKITDEQRDTIIGLMGNGASAVSVSKVVGSRPFIVQRVFNSALLKAGLSKSDKRMIMEWANNHSPQVYREKD